MRAIGTIAAAAAVALSGLPACGPRTAPATSPPEAEISVPPGFRVTVFAPGVGRARHLAVRANGDVYVRLSGPRGGPGIVALRDEDGDGRADREERFEASVGTGIRVEGNWLYFSTIEGVYRYALPEEGLTPAGPPEPIAAGFPQQRQHASKNFALDGRGSLYVNVGAPSNACQLQTRTPGSPGLAPCPQLERQAGIWRFASDRIGQLQQRDGRRYATGLRNCVALAWNRAAGKLYAVPHGRDQLSALWPDRFTPEQNAELPAEEFHLVREGGDYGWPYTYFDPLRGERMLAPEYGGDGKTPAEAARYEEPLVAFPAHWAPNDLLFYDGDNFPERYRGGAFIAFHGSWNRAPLPQRGYNVAFVPFDGERPSGPFEIFADGFAGRELLRSPGDARYRPMGLAQAPDGALLVVESNRGRIFRIVYERR